MFVYSAYLDDRLKIRVSRKLLPVVRIFAYFPRGAMEEQKDGPWLCLFWQKELDSPPSVVPVMGYLDLDIYRSTGFEFDVASLNYFILNIFQ